MILDTTKIGKWSEISHIKAPVITSYWGLLVKIFSIRVDLNSVDLVGLVITGIIRFACKFFTKLSVPKCTSYFNKSIFQSPAMKHA